jgi:hypothetical protein
MSWPFVVLLIDRGSLTISQGSTTIAETLTAEDTLRMPEIDVEVPMTEFYAGIEPTEEPAAESA